MKTIVSEDFSLTPAIEQAIESKMAKIKKFVGEDNLVRVYLSKEGKTEFKVIFRVVLFHREITASAQDTDFYKALNESKTKFLRQVVEANNQIKNHRVDKEKVEAAVAGTTYKV